MGGHAAGRSREQAPALGSRGSCAAVRRGRRSPSGEGPPPTAAEARNATPWERRHTLPVPPAPRPCRPPPPPRRQRRQWRRQRIPSLLRAQTCRCNGGQVGGTHLRGALGLRGRGLLAPHPRLETRRHREREVFGGGRRSAARSGEGGDALRQKGVGALLRTPGGGACVSLRQLHRRADSPLLKGRGRPPRKHVLRKHLRLRKLGHKRPRTRLGHVDKGGALAVERLRLVAGAGGRRRARLSRARQVAEEGGEEVDEGEPRALVHTARGRGGGRAFGGGGRAFGGRGKGAARAATLLGAKGAWGGGRGRRVGGAGEGGRGRRGWAGQAGQAGVGGGGARPRPRRARA